MGIDNHTSILIRKVPAKLRNAFKALCANRGLTMNQKLIDLVADYVKDDSKHGRTKRS